MKPIAFIDTEIDPKTGKILDIGCIKEDRSSFHSHSTKELIDFLNGAEYICGHNIFKHDLRYIFKHVAADKMHGKQFIDTLYLSPLLFPSKPYHALLKDDKLQTEDANNPLNDSIKARDLFFDEVTAFLKLDDTLKHIYFLLLSSQKEFDAFFRFIGYSAIQPNTDTDIEYLIRKKFFSQICEQANLRNMISGHPVELAYCLALIHTKSRYSITPPWVIKNFPDVERIMYLLRNSPCLTGCVYCDEALDSKKGLKRFFGFDSYRSYAGQSLQEQAVNAAIANQSLLAVFPTGGGKSITFQVPALMSGLTVKGLTVVISPLQSLMKDQVDNLEKNNITDAVTINGLLDPIERANAFERVENGSASILYISPESLRSKTIERLLLGRNVVRFVIDEAHCFSAWGQDFRVDYLYIGDFIKEFQKKKHLENGIPVSCFTATAKQKVIEDIRQYFKEKLEIDMELFSSDASRSNLRYKVLKKDTEEKYTAVRNLLEIKKCPTIIYVSRTYRAYQLANRLSEDGYQAKPYHGKMDKQEKSANQDAFMRGEVQIMVATSAFGMGVDKKDVGMVIHYDISDSLENYVQEAGRAGRDESISADCFVLFNDEDLNKHFVLLNQTKLSIREIQQIWRAIKDITRFRSKVSQSALEIARKAGWDDSVDEIETRVKTAIAALEEAGYIKRGQNMPKIYANSILSQNAQEAITKIATSDKFDDKQKQKATRIIKKLFSSKSRKHVNDEVAEARVDYISDHLGIVKEEVIQIVNLLREEKILADTKDLTAFIRKNENSNHSLSILNSYRKIEEFLSTVIDTEEKTLHIKELNELAEANGCHGVTPNKLKILFNFWVIKNLIKRHTPANSKNHITIVCLESSEAFQKKLANRHELAQFIVEYLYEKSDVITEKKDAVHEDVIVEFSVLELKEQFEQRNVMFATKTSLKEIEDALFYLSRIEALKIEGGFLVVYNGLTIERLETNNKKQYKVEDYQQLNRFYETRIQQIHIVGEYASKMINDYKAALEFVDDYFRLNYSSFLDKYFKGSRQNEIKQNITPAKFKKLFGELSPTQLKIINDKDSKNIVVAAGPGSGKTRILVHKLASLMLMEDVKHEQMLMVTFSRSAAVEFKKRLFALIGNSANFIEIKTFHSYCFDLLGKVGTLEKSSEIVQEAVKRIKNREVEAGRITKSVLVIDEAQDMDSDEFALITALMEYNEEMRVIAVGDDDQNIYEFRGASSKYLVQLIREQKAVMYELVENYRSNRNLVAFANQYVQNIPNRLKQTPIVAVRSDNGRIKLVRYTSSHLITPVANDILSRERTGSTCVLTKTNDEALQITGLLVKNGVKAKLIQSNEGFSLYNLMEIRFFLEQLHLTVDMYVISDEDWHHAKNRLKDRFGTSLNLGICLTLIRDFELTNPKVKYKSDLEIFIRESKLEDFIAEDAEIVYVATIHKAKGREFDNVWLLLDQFNHAVDEARRQLYVALTRAKNNLTIHYNGNYFDSIETEALITVNDSRQYSFPDLITMQLSLKDVWLDFFQTSQKLISKFTSGDILTADKDGCPNHKGQTILKYSKQFLNLIENMKQKGYQPVTAKIRFIVYWKKENTDCEIRIVLPEINFKKVTVGDV